MLKNYKILVIFLLLAVIFSDRAYAQQYGVRTGERRGGAVTFEPRGPGVLFGPLDPVVKKWYVPQELYQEYQWKSWEYSNYARDPYERYVDIALEGDYFYDLYGNYVTKGWLIYDWRQEAPAPLGSSLFKDTRYNTWFSSVLVSSDSKGSHYYSITVGDRIRTTLTPLTFSKPRYNGIQLDLASDRYEATVLLSRISSPVVGSSGTTPRTRTNGTNLIGGRATAQVGDFVKVGATFINAHNARSTVDAFSGNSFKGTLGEDQAAQPGITAIAVVLSDDSPEDGVGGSALFDHDITIVRQDFQTGRRHTLRLEDLTNDPTRWPIILGGFPEEGFLAADGLERIVINYDFTDPSYTGPSPTEIVKVTFDMVLANDFKVQVWSNRQTGGSRAPIPPLSGEIIDETNPALLDIMRAEDNIKDSSNRQRVVFDYGLPTANQIYGFTLEVKDVKDFDLYAEFDINHRFRQYPNFALFTEEENFEVTSSRSEAGIVNLSYRSYPWFFLGEAFTMDPDYSTSPFIVNSQGGITYDNPGNSLYEFVDDNDDQDRTPDWIRANHGGPDPSVFPGWDENNDFISDFNQNDNRAVTNRIPDYEEPFLRYGVDRPEFLFGIDLDNNTTIDRFENDAEPDFPYQRDHRGYNAYIGAHIVPDVRLSVGQLREELISSEKKNITTYGLFTLEKNYPRLGRLRIFEMLKRTKDSIPGNRFGPQLFLQAETPGIVADILPAQDTWINTFWTGLDYTRIPNVNIINKIKYESFTQRSDDPRAVDRSPLNDDSSFFGLINKADYTYRIGDLVIRPRFKSEFLRQTPFSERDDRRREWAKMPSLILKFPMLRETSIELGAEFLHFTELRADEDDLLEKAILGPTGDFTESVFAIQWETLTDYLGYNLILQTGFKFSRTSIETIKATDLEIEKKNEVETSSTTFMIFYAGVQQ